MSNSHEYNSYFTKNWQKSTVLQTTETIGFNREIITAHEEGCWGGSYFARKASSTTAEMSRRGLPIPRSTPSDAIPSTLRSVERGGGGERRASEIWLEFTARWVKVRRREMWRGVRRGVLVGLAQTSRGPLASLRGHPRGWWALQSSSYPLRVGTPAPAPTVPTPTDVRARVGDAARVQCGDSVHATLSSL